jgi:hypothetical protein
VTATSPRARPADRTPPVREAFCWDSAAGECRQVCRHMSVGRLRVCCAPHCLLVVAGSPSRGRSVAAHLHCVLCGGGDVRRKQRTELRSTSLAGHAVGQHTNTTSASGTRSTVDGDCPNAVVMLNAVSREDREGQDRRSRPAEGSRNHSSKSPGQRGRAGVQLTAAYMQAYLDTPLRSER